MQQRIPGTPVIRRYRRDNREALHRCLTAAGAGWLQSQPKPASGESLPAAIAEDATLRIMKAMFVDSVARPAALSITLA